MGETFFDHRIIKHPEKDGRPEWYGIHEVYYDEDGNIALVDHDPEVTGESLEDLKLGLKLIATALNKEILVNGEFEESELQTPEDFVDK